MNDTHVVPGTRNENKSEYVPSEVRSSNREKKKINPVKDNWCIHLLSDEGKDKIEITCQTRFEWLLHLWSTVIMDDLRLAIFSVHSFSFESVLRVFILKFVTIKLTWMRSKWLAVDRAIEHSSIWVHVVSVVMCMPDWLASLNRLNAMN